MDIFFFLKKVVARFCDPLTATMLVAVVVIAIMTVKAEWTGYRGYAAVAIFGILWVLSTPIFSHLILTPLERDKSIPVYLPEKDHADVIVVLGCGHTENTNLPLSSRYQSCSIRRVVHALMLKEETGLPIAFSGGVMPGNDESEGDYNIKLALSMGMSSDGLSTCAGTSVDTASEARLLSTEMAGKKLVLVTSAAHMPRTYDYFIKEGFDVFPSPTDHSLVFESLNYKNPNLYIPDRKSLAKTYVAFYEYAGLFSQRVFGE
jgi:uncharacterized SAM-binding protein YcdF (DUF218 family)